MNIKRDRNWICRECGDPNRKHEAKGLCGPCYRKLWKREKRRAAGVKSRPDWKKYDRCIDCGSAKIDSHGRCSSCRKRWLRKTNPGLYYERKRVFDQIRSFGGDPSVVRRREYGQCERCGMTSKEHKKKWGVSLGVHHIDGNGSKSATPNHAPSNLMILCKRCHRALHWENREKEAS